MEEEFDPFSLGGHRSPSQIYAESEHTVKGFNEQLVCFPSSKTERQMNLFKFALEVVYRDLDRRLK